MKAFESSSTVQEILNERARPRQAPPERTATPPTPQARLQPDADEDEEASLAQQLTVHICVPGVWLAHTQQHAGFVPAFAFVAPSS